MGTYKWSFPSGMVSQINSEKIKLTPAYSSPYETDGAFDVKVVNGATAAVYTITCNTESCETTGTLTIKDCGGGGDTCDGGIILIESEGRDSGSITLPTEGGTLRFTQQDWYIDDKTLSATDSGRLQVGTLPTAGTWTLAPDNVSWLGALTIEDAKIYAENVTASTPADITTSITATCSDCVSNEPITFEITKKGSSPAPPTECVAGTWTTTTPTETVLSNAYGCTNENGSWEGGGSLTVEIRNKSNYYIPFNGEIKDKQPTDIEHHFRVPSIVESVSSSHYWYGRTTSEGQDTNFLVPPHATATLTGCMGTFSQGIYHFYISILEGDDYKLHAEDISFSDEVSVSYEDNKVIFTIPTNIDGTRWRGDNITTSYGHKGDFHYALTWDEVTSSTHCSRFHYKTDNGQGVQKVRIVPVHLNPNVDWGAVKTALTKNSSGKYNSNNYYPYKIEEN